MSLLSTAITGIKAHQTALETTGHNISNANTPGYSRQEAVMATNNPLFRGVGYIGQGVNISTVRRVTDEFLTIQLRQDTSTFHDLQTYRESIEQVDRILADDATGLQPQLDRYFAALQGAADNPAYIPSRDVVLGEAQGLVDRFETISRYLQDINSTLNGQLKTSTEQVNAIAKGIAELNEEIVTARGDAAAQPPNDLYDKRDELVRQLSELVEVDVVKVGETYNIAIGNGQPLVLKYDANRLEATPSLEDPNRYGIRYTSKTENLDITDNITGGSIGGRLEFRSEALDLAVNSLGRLAVAFVQETNAQHKQGIDLEGRFGNDFFRDMNDPSLTGDRVYAYGTNKPPNDRVFNVTFENTKELTTSEYTLNLPGPDASRFEVIRKFDGKVVEEGALTGDYPQAIEFDGLKVTLESGTFQQGDTFTIAPLRFAAEDVEKMIQRPAELALAYPVRAESSLSNVGSGYIDQGQMLSRDSKAFAVDGALTPPLVIKFESPTRYSVYDNSDPGRPVPLEPPLENIPFVPGTANTIFTDDPGETIVSSWRARLPQTPAIGNGGPSTAYLYNGINPERFQFFQTDPVTGKETELDRVSTGYGASAYEIAEELNLVEGVTARAYTEVQLSNFSNSTDTSGAPTYNPHNPMEVWVNGFELTQEIPNQNQNIYMDGFPVEVPEEMNPNFLADRINHHYELQQLGITAKSDGETLTITDENGNDILVEMRGDKPQPVISGAPVLPPGIPGNVTDYIDPGDTFEISTGESWSVDPFEGNTNGQLSNLNGYDFSEGGPYRYEMYLPDGRTGTVRLDGIYADGDAVKAAFEEQIQAQLDSPGRAEVDIDEQGNVSYKVFMRVEGTGTQAVSRVNVGGQVDVVMADGIRLETDPEVGGIFNGVPDARSSYMGFQFQVGGRPEAGDEFTIEWNDAGVSDNRNALDLVGLETTDTINDIDGGMTFTESYSQTVEQIGTLTSQAQIRSDASRAVLEGTQSEVDSVQGVNLDEEAARLIEFQVAYNANAKVIAVAQELFDSILAAF
ncbi:flagellar hook-associated protein FlgK [Reinekea blandensis]|uniref:Flagellar hook-associated protein 1 n=1 Tax=Reinekea blandensis MED297 TaxID=314283 RepID=A4BEM3_9GAMM|nr:flagellar hook-associated protein FlgK [Reinekea blandensis]EAR09450.1 Flagellar hook-associated protein [Reinekea sp. MED297] [Reinekea blandensis MED297]